MNTKKIFSKRTKAKKLSMKLCLVKVYVGLYFICNGLVLSWLLSDESDKAIYRERYSVPLPSLTIPDAVHGTFDEFTTRTSRIVPLAMALFRAQTINATNKLKFLFDFNWNWLPGVWHRHDSPSAKVPLTSDDYQRMLNHINAHIETIIEKKLESIERNLRPESDTIDPTIALHIATIVKEQIIQYKYVLTDADIERIANVVREKITSDGESRSKAIPLTQANLEEMSRLIQQKIEIHQHEWNMNANANANGKPAETDHEKVDVHEILYKILTSVELADFVNKRFGAKAQVFSTQLSDHQITIDTLRNDMNALKEQLKSVFAVNDMAKESIDSLHAEHSQLSDRLASMQAEQNEQLKKLLESIDVKLNAFNEKQISSIDNHIRNALVEIFGYRSSDGKPLTNADLANWIQSIFVAKELLETRLSALNAKYEHRFDDEINHMAEVVIRNVSETIKRDIAIALEQSGSERRDAKVMHHDIDESLNEAHIQQLIQKALAVYDADKTGMVDYALESSGGEVLSTRCTEKYDVKAEISIFGIPIWHKSNTPRSVITPTMQPGECWSFRGFPGYLVLKLSHPVYVTGFTMEHIPKSIAPGGIDSAPKSFTVWGLTTVNDNESHQFGEYEYFENGTSLQYFPVQNTDYQSARSHNIVELRIESNHGNNNYTCLYRFRVHGKLTPTTLS